MRVGLHGPRFALAGPQDSGLRNVHEVSLLQPVQCTHRLSRRADAARVGDRPHVDFAEAHAPSYACPLHGEAPGVPDDQASGRELPCEAPRRPMVRKAMTSAKTRGKQGRGVGGQGAGNSLQYRPNRGLAYLLGSMHAMLKSAQNLPFTGEGRIPVPPMVRSV